MKQLLSLAAIYSVFILGRATSCQDSCPCPDLLPRLFAPNNTLYSEGPGCVRNVTCRTGSGTYVGTSFDRTEFKKPEDALTNNVFIESASADQTSSSVIDFFTYFGIVCENNQWYVTKYPNGWTYDIETEPYAKRGGLSGEDDGKKSVAAQFQWQVLVLKIFLKNYYFSA